MAKSILGDQNVKKSATSCEKKSSWGTAGKFYGKMDSGGTLPGNMVFGNTTIGKTMQDYGNSKTQVVRG